MKVTERLLLDALHRKYHTERGVRRWAFATHVRTDSGFEARNIIDAVAVELWRSHGHDIHGFETKCTRDDWLNEIKPRVIKKGFTIDPYGTFPGRVVPPIIRQPLEKSAKARELCDTFTIVAPKGVVRVEELPEAWGLIEATEVDGKAKLRTVTAAKRLDGQSDGRSGTRNERATRAMSRSFAISIMRQVRPSPEEE